MPVVVVQTSPSNGMVGVTPWAMLIDDEGHFLGWVSCDDLQESKSIRDTATPPTVTGTPDTPLNEALSKMFDSAVGNLAVLDNEERLVGVLSFEIIREVLGRQASEAKVESCGEEQ